MGLTSGHLTWAVLRKLFFFQRIKKNNLFLFSEELDLQVITFVCFDYYKKWNLYCSWRPRVMLFVLRIYS